VQLVNAETPAGTRRRILLITPSADDLVARLRGLPSSVELAVLPADRLADPPGSPVASVVATGGFVFVDAAARGAADVAARCLDAGARVLISDPAALPPTSVDALCRQAREAPGEVCFGGLGIGSLPLATLLGALHRNEIGSVVSVALRSPGGRRRLPAASRRTPFRDQDASFTLDPEALGRMQALCAPAHRLLALLVPGAAGRVWPTELVAEAGAERYTAHGLAGGIAVSIDLDRQMVGEGPFEVDVVGTAGRRIVRWGEGEGRDVLLASNGSGMAQVPLERRETEELLFRHVLAGAGGPLSSADAVADAWARTEAILVGAEARRRDRPVDVVLVHVPRFRNRRDELRLPSLAVARLAAFMRGYGFKVHVVDLAAVHDYAPLDVFVDDAAVDAHLAGERNAKIDAIVDALWPSLSAALSRKSLVGFSIVDYYGHFQMNLASCLAERVKRETGHPIVLGGERDQVDGDRGLAAHMPFDWVCDGDGELALLELSHLVAYADRRAADIPGIWSRDEAGGGLVRNAVVRSHLNAMPRPDFDGIPLDAYRGGLSRRLLDRLAADGLAPEPPVPPFLYLPYAFVKGCTAKCTFCSAKEYLNVQSPEKAAGELCELAVRHDVRDFMFLNNLVNFGRRWLETFCTRLVDSKLDLQWTDSCRPTGIDDDLAGLMRASGCLLLNFGAESGSDAILDRMKKGLGRQDILDSLRATHRAGILNRVNLIAGYFHETGEDVDLTISLVEGLRDEIDVVGCFQGFYLFPGMGVDPEQEKIALRPGFDRLHTGQLTLAYDEIDGLPWEEKKEAIDASRNRILARIESLGIRTLDKINEYDLFWLSRRFRDKATVVRYLLDAPEPTTEETAFPNSGDLPPGGQRGSVVIGSA
jgi:radical SAM superfamily enzyme YgiQ (UPF0313 family)